MMDGPPGVESIGTLEQRSPGEWVRAIRLALDLTQDELGARIAYSREMVRKIEADERRLSADAAQRLTELAPVPDAERESLHGLLRGAGTRGRAPTLEVSTPLNTPTTPPPPNPYRGLLAFREADADNFFGRGEVVQRLMANLRQHQTVVVVGPSGSGKSSLVYAGLLPGLRRDAGWETMSLRPGETPFHSLGMALVDALEPELTEAARITEARQLAAGLATRPLDLRDATARLTGPAGEATKALVIVDQFEELFTLVADHSERQRFIDLLVKPQGPPEACGWRTLLTLRADFLGDALQHPALGVALQQSSVLLGPMSSGALGDVVEAPAARAGVRFEAGLVSRILQDHGSRGALPLLEFTLSLLWERQQHRIITHHAYDTIGGVTRALVIYAEDAYDRLPPADQQRVRRVVMQMVQPGDSPPDTRRWALRSEIGDELWPLVRSLSSARLVVTSYDEQRSVETAELAHDALVSEWPRVQGWLHDDRAFRQWQERLRIRDEGWRQGKQDPSMLLHGAELSIAEQWIAGRSSELSDEEVDYLDASLVLRETQQRMASRRTALMTGFFAVMAAIFMLAAAVAALGWGQASQQKAVAQARFLAAEAQAHLLDQQDLALLLALLATRQAPSPEAQGALMDALFYSRQLMTYLYRPPGAILAVAASPDGKLLATAGTDHSVQIWDSYSLRPNGLPLEGHSSWVVQMRFSPDGRRLATASADRSVGIWDVAERRLLRWLTGHSREVLGAAFSPDGRTLATGSSDKTIILWDVASGQPIGDPLRGHLDEVMGVAFSANGQILASASFDRTVRLWDAASGRPLGEPLTGHADEVWGVAFTPDGERLASGSLDGTVRVWDVAGREVLFELATPEMVPLGRIAIGGPEGKLLATANRDGRVNVWDLSTRRLAYAPLSAHQTLAMDVAFTADGTRLLSGGIEGSGALWDARTGVAVGSPFRRFVADVAVSKQVVFDAQGERPGVITAGADGNVRFWDVGDRALRGDPLKAPAETVAFARSADQRSIALATADNVIRIWDALDAHKPPVEIAGVVGGRALALSKVGEYVVYGDADGMLHRWHTRTRQLAGPPVQAHVGSLLAVAIDPADRLIASAGADGHVRLFELSTGNPIGSGAWVHQGAIQRLTFSLDATLLATGGADGHVHLWDVADSLSEGPPASKFGGAQATTAEPHAAGTPGWLLGAHKGPVTALRFNQAGSIVVSGGEDGAIRLWDVKSRHQIGRGLLPVNDLEAHQGAVLGLDLSVDDRLLVSVGADKTIRLWNLDFAHWPDLACAFARRNLTPEEWRTYLPNEPYRKVCARYE